jgi:hypothetical protein
MIFSPCFPQSYIREQDGSNYSFNLVKQTLVYLDEVCGGAQSLGLFIHEDNANIVIQCLRVRVNRNSCLAEQT